jgi:hypothetical protein
MRAIDWHKFLQTQRDEHQKVVFTPSELANVAGRDPRSLSVTLQRLVRRGVLQRYAPGRYGLPGAAGPEDLVSLLDGSAYVTGMYALYRHGMVTQRPAEITCFTLRRHNRSRVRQTPVGRLVFVCVAPPLYAPPEKAVIVSPEQALCDFVYLCRRRGVVASDIVTFRNLERLDRRALRDRLARYPRTVDRDVSHLLARQGG